LKRIIFKDSPAMDINLEDTLIFQKKPTTTEENRKCV
jgi:hypothetical protein